ncbi:MFS transporter [Streptomyces sp. NPDC021562]|uniref:MFS transporter n=1 Tax=Streptomyces sp. NPDC021562 TaxID=3155121 RepID=UPI0033C44A49
MNTKTDRQRVGRLLLSSETRNLTVVGTLVFVGVGAEPLAMLLFLVHATGSFGSAGIVIGCYGLSSAATAPVRGRLADRYGAAVLTVIATAHLVLTLALVAAGEAHAPLVVLVLTSAAVGTGYSAVYAAMRSAWSRLTGEQDRESAYAVQAVLQEIGYIGGPAGAGAAIAQAGTTFALLATSCLTWSATLVFSQLSAVRSQPRAAVQMWSRPAVMASGPLAVLIATTAPTAFAFAVVEVDLPAYATRHAVPGIAGLLIALVAIGSLVGGLAYGHRTWRSALDRRYAAILLLLALLMTALSLARSMPAVVLLTLLVGLPAAPMITCRYLLLDGTVPNGFANEAFMWITTADAIGDSAGKAIGGFLVERSSFGLVSLVAGLAATLAMLITVLGCQTLRRSVPAELTV